MKFSSALIQKLILKSDPWPTFEGAYQHIYKGVLFGSTSFYKFINKQTKLLKRLGKQDYGLFYTSGSNQNKEDSSCAKKSP